MAKKKHPSEDRIDNPLDKEFIRVLTDFGFKKLFGTEEHVDILKRFLNALFVGRLHVKSIVFRPTELHPERKNRKKIHYDIYCTTDTGHHFIVEMQQIESENFADRMLFYGCRAIVNQGKRGTEYVMSPVYCIVVTNFNMTGKESRMLKEFLFAERTTHEIYSDTLQLIFLSLPEVPEEWDECKTELEKLLYIIKNMENMTKDSKAYLSGEFDEIFEASKTEKLSSEEAVAYSDSYYKELDYRSAIRFAAKKNRREGIEEGREEGIKEGIKKGRKEGRKKGLLEGALNELKNIVNTMRSNGLSNEHIAQMIGKDPKIIASI